MGAAVVALILWLALDTAQRPEQLISFAGICMFILILFACSKHHSAVSLGYVVGHRNTSKGYVEITKCPCQVYMAKTELSNISWNLLLTGLFLVKV